MPFTVQCPGCGSQLRAGDKLAGRRVKCPKCSGVIEVPRPDQAMEASPRRESPPVLTTHERSSGEGTTSREDSPPDAPQIVVTPHPENIGARRKKSQVPDVLILWGTMVLFILGVVAWENLFPPSSDDKETPRQWVQAVIDKLPKDGIYSAPAGKGGSYRDPIHGFFEVEPPEGFQIRERRDKIEFTGEPGFPLEGQTLRRSWVDFLGPDVEIGVIVRKSETSIEEDFEFMLQGCRQKLGDDAIHRTRYVTVDGVRGGEMIVLADEMGVLGVKYKKHGLDHAITMGYDIGQFRKAEESFLGFMRSYRSVKPE